MCLSKAHGSQTGADLTQWCLQPVLKDHPAFFSARERFLAHDPVQDAFISGLYQKLDPDGPEDQEAAAGVAPAAARPAKRQRGRPCAASTGTQPVLSDVACLPLCPKLKQSSCCWSRASVEGYGCKLLYRALSSCCMCVTSTNCDLSSSALVLG